MYLREYFVDYDVDVEYNRHGTQVKRLYRLGRLVENHPRDRDETQPQSVLPDVIVHKRGVNDSNLLVIEVKQSSNRQGMNGDQQRIKAFREQLGYEVGVLVVCQTGDRPEIYPAEMFV